jgi:UDP-N-acetylglucosamine acyltransferase
MKDAQVSTLSHVHPGAQLAPDVQVDPFVTIHEDVVVGEGSWIGSNAVLQNGTRIGANCRIFPGAIISTIPQDLKYQGEYTTTEIRDGVTVREFATINRGTAYSNKTLLKEGALVMAYAHIAHDCIIGEGAIIANTVNIAGHVIIEDFAIVGGMCAIHQFCQIGQHSMISGGSLVRKDVPPFVIAAREPLSYVGTNYRGLSRRGFTHQKIQELQEIYRVIFLSGHNMRHATQIIEQEFAPTQERDAILTFIAKSERGLLRGYQFNGRLH